VKLIHVLCAVAVLAVYLPYTNHEYAHATHLARGCAAPPAYMEVPHWVANYICDNHQAHGEIGAISVWMTQEDGSMVDILSLYISQEAADRGDMNQYLASAVFQLDEFGNRRRLLIFGVRDGSKKYVAHGAPAGLEL